MSTVMNRLKLFFSSLMKPEVVLMVLVLILPFAIFTLQSNFLEYSKAVLVYAILVLIGLILVGSVLKNKQINLIIHQTDAILIGFLILVGLGSLLGSSPLNSITGFNLMVGTSFVSFFALVCLFFLAKNFLSSKQAVKGILACLSISGFLLVINNILRGIIPFLNVELFTQSFSAFSLFLGLSAIASGTLYLLCEKRLWKILASLNFILLSLVLIWLDSPIGLLTVIVFIFSFIVLTSLRPGTLTGKFTTILTGYMLLMTLALLLPLRSWIGQSPIIDLALPLKYSAQIALETLKHNALFGTGLQNFANAFYAYKPAAYNTTLLWNIGFVKAGSFFFELLTTAGLLGTIAFYLPFLSFVFLGMKQLRKRAVAEDLTAVKADVTDIILLSILFAILILSLIVNFELVLLVIFFVLAGSLSGRVLNNIKVSRSLNPGIAQIFAYLGLLIIIIPTYYLGRILVSNYYLAGVSAADAAAISRSIENVDTAVELYPWQAENYLLRAQLRLASLEGSTEAQKTELAGQVRSDLESAKASAGDDYQAYAALRAVIIAYSQAVSAEGVDLQAVHSKMKSLNPNNPELYYLEADDSLGLIEGGVLDKIDDSAKREQVKKELEDSVKNNLGKALNLKADYALAYNRYGDYYTMIGDLAAAETNYTKALILEPLNKEYLMKVVRSYASQKKYTEAHQLLERYMKDNVDDLDLLKMQQAIFTAEGNVVEAKKMEDRIKELTEAAKKVQE